MSHFVNLEIVVPEAFIVGGPEHHVVVGGSINLVCVIEKCFEEMALPDELMKKAAGIKFKTSAMMMPLCFLAMLDNSPTPPQYVLWYHNSRMINYDTSRGGVEVRTLPGQKTESHLNIKDAKFTDSGNYTCSASNTQPASITVFVSEGDKMAAISPRKSKSEASTARKPALIMASLSLCLLYQKVLLL